MKKIFRYVFILGLWAPLVALGWTPGEANPDWPHVVAGEEEGQWVPEEGWRFANDEPGDFTVVPMDGEVLFSALHSVLFEPAKPLKWWGSGAGMLEIPAPEGFLSVKPGTFLADFYAKIAAADPENTMLAHWVELEGDEVVCDAYVNEMNELRGKRLTSAEFRQLAQMMAKANGTMGKSVEETVERSEQAGGEILEEMGGDGSDFSISGMRWLSPHRNEGERVAFTMVSNAGVGDDVTWTANTCCILWLQGHVLFFYMAHHTKDAEAMDEAIAESRRKLDLWCDAVVAADRSQQGAGLPLSSDLLFADREIEMERQLKSDLFREDLNRSARKGANQGRLIAVALFAVAGLFVAWIRRARSSGGAGGAGGSWAGPGEDGRNLPEYKELCERLGIGHKGVGVGEAGLLVGIEAGGGASGAARFAGGGLRPVRLPEEVAEKLSRCEAKDRFTESDAVELKAALEKELGQGVGGVVVALSGAVGFAERMAFNKAMKAAGLPVRRVLERGVAAAYAELVRHGGPTETIRVTETGVQPEPVCLARVGDGVCDVIGAGLADGLAKENAARSLELPVQSPKALMGASMLAAVLMKELKDCLLLEKLGFDIGLMRADRKVLRLMEGDASLPVRKAVDLGDFAAGAGASGMLCPGVIVGGEFLPWSAASLFGLMGASGFFRESFDFLLLGTGGKDHLGVTVDVYVNRQVFICLWDKESGKPLQGIVWAYTEAEARSVRLKEES